MVCSQNIQFVHQDGRIDDAGSRQQQGGGCPHAGLEFRSPTAGHRLNRDPVFHSPFPVCFKYCRFLIVGRHNQFSGLAMGYTVLLAKLVNQSIALDAKAGFEGPAGSVIVKTGMNHPGIA